MKKIKTTLMILLLCMSVIPVLLLGTIVTWHSSVTLTEEIQQQVKDGLKSVSVSLISAYENMYEGDFKQDERGNVVKGEGMITGDYKMIDQIKKNAGVNASMFFGDTRILTTVKDSNGNRIIGTQASGKVVETVLNQGKEYFGTDVLVEGIYYYGYYIPLKNSDGNTVGMMFAGRPSAVVSAHIKSEVMKIATIALIIMILAIILCVFVAKYIIKYLLSVTSSLVYYLKQRPSK